MIFTVLIPLYNKKEYIHIAIESVLKQTYPNFELLVVDDGSTDGSAAITNYFKDARLRYIKKEHSGVAATRNRGIKEANSAYIAFLDADDWWAPTFLEEMAAAIVKFPKEKLFSTGRTHVFENKTIPYKNKLLPAVEKTVLLNHYQVISNQLPAINMSNAVVLKQHIENAGYLKEGMQNHEDHEFWLRMAIDTSLVYINKPLSFYRKNVLASQSEKVFTATDFSIYLSTCKQVKTTLSKKEKDWFQTYLNTFVLLSYLKYRSHYSKNEIILLEAKIDTMLTGVAFAIYSVTEVFPSINFYKLLKKLNGKRK